MPQIPPSGWAILQEKARRTKDPAKLAGIIDEMNQLLAECEKSNGDHTKKPQSKAGERATRARIGNKKQR